MSGLLIFPEVSSYLDSSFHGCNVDHMTLLKRFKNLKLTTYKISRGKIPSLDSPNIFCKSAPNKRFLEDFLILHVFILTFSWKKTELRPYKKLRRKERAAKTQLLS